LPHNTFSLSKCLTLYNMFICLPFPLFCLSLSLFSSFLFIYLLISFSFLLTWFSIDFGGVVFLDCRPKDVDERYEIYLECQDLPSVTYYTWNKASCSWNYTVIENVLCGKISHYLCENKAYTYFFSFLSPILAYFPVFFVVTGRCVDKGSPGR
jgi:hypothetical protein